MSCHQLKVWIEKNYIFHLPSSHIIISSPISSTISFLSFFILVVKFIGDRLQQNDKNNENNDDMVDGKKEEKEEEEEESRVDKICEQIIDEVFENEKDER